MAKIKVSRTDATIGITHEGVTYNPIRSYVTDVYDQDLKERKPTNLTLAKAGDAYFEIQHDQDGGIVVVRPVKAASTKVIEVGSVYLTASPVEPLEREDAYNYGPIAYVWKWAVQGNINGQPVKLDPFAVARLKKFFKSIDTESLGEIESF